ncbi:hypothetical protein [Cytobacillus firmus]|uniref:hypothetical protein n=1 Tax=Cytobacillus firmus TaxID=1399 RepID=UPI00300287EB
MKCISKEDGYALITVLLVITIFFLLVLSFMGHAVNTSKQNQQIESNSQSVDLAEMGIAYVAVALKNVYVSSQQQVSKLVYNEKETDQLKEINRPDSYYKNRAISIMAEYLENGLSNETLEKHMGENTAAYFVIEDLIIKQKNEGIDIHFSSIGSEGNKNTSLKAKMTILIDNISTQNGDSTGASISFDEISKPLNLPSKCVNKLFLPEDCKEILVEGSASYSGNYNGMSGRTIYTTGNLSLSGNANKVENTKIHTGGSLSVGKNMNHLENTILEVKGAASFGGQLRTDNTIIKTAGSMNIAGHYELNGGSFSYIEGSLAVEKHLNISSSSKLCVSGNVIASQIYASGDLIIMGVISGKVKSGRPQYVNRVEFLDLCSKPVNDFFIEWKNIQSDIEYSY